jgi:hypothetical protein
MASYNLIVVIVSNKSEKPKHKQEHHIVYEPINSL